MALNHSPKIVTDGLVFAYDMANTKKSWKGRPVTNQFAIPTPGVNGDVGFQVNGTGTFRRIFSGTYGGYDIGPNDIVYRYDLGATGCHYHGNDVTINAGQTATWSFDYYVDPSVTGYPSTNYLANFEGVIGGSAGDPTPTQIGVWKRITFTGTAGSTGTCRMLLYPGACGDRLATGGFVLFKNPQVEFDAPGNNPSPFVAGTRSNTQALVDLTGNNTITASSLTYASDGTFSFNGSSNKMTNVVSAAFVPSTNTIGRSWEVIVKPGASMTAAGIFGHVLGAGCTYFCNGGICIESGQYKFNWYDNVAYQFLASGVTATNGQYAHIIGTFDPSDLKMRIYVNGTLMGTSAATNLNYGNAANEYQIGYLSASGNSYTGKIDVCRYYYNKTLSAAEVKQNFNALRGRYGL